MLVDLQAQYARLREDIGRRIQRVLDHGQYIHGPEVAELEARLAAFAGVRHCVAVSSGTDALLLALLALGIGPGDEVITTPFTFVATSEAIRLAGARPVYADIDARTYALDPARVEALVTPRTRAILAVDLFGQCADYAALNAIAARHGLPIIEDAAQSFGAVAHGRRAGSLATIGTTSFYPAKPLGCYGDGGACFTDDAALAAALRELRVHGQDGTYRYARVGINGRLDTLQAAILLAKLEVFPDEIERRGAVARRHDERLAGLVRTPFVAPGHTSVYAQYTIEVDARDAVREALTAAGVATAVHYPTPLHRAAPYRDDTAVVPCAERAATRVLSLPMHPYLEAAEQDRIAAALARALAAAAAPVSASPRAAAPGNALPTAPRP
jgi:UDP-2-acetamido-2-deoxy-ribo-hexuluronate aminotransferase